jgi:hypothetical protein
MNILIHSTQLDLILVRRRGIVHRIWRLPMLFLLKFKMLRLFQNFLCCIFIYLGLGFFLHGNFNFTLLLTETLILSLSCNSLNFLLGEILCMMALILSLRTQSILLRDFNTSLNGFDQTSSSQKYILILY